MLEKIKFFLKDATKALGVVGSPSDSFEVVIDIKEINETSKLLGELACFYITEGEKTVLVLGQITEIKTINRWHEEPSLKGIIKRRGGLPNLSGIADNRIAKINVQSSFVLSETTQAAHKLANSPSTGIAVHKVTNEIMQELMTGKEGLVCLGTAYDTDVNVPFWLKHFGSPEDDGAGEAYHIGIFGRTGSGKTTAAANMLLGYARHKDYMNILILDPQEQFYEDNKVLPQDAKFKEKTEAQGMTYCKYILPKEVVLPANAQLLSDLLLNYGFIKTAFDILTEEKQREMRDAIMRYVESRLGYEPNVLRGSEKLYKDMLNYFLNENNVEERDPLKRVYSQKTKVVEIKDNIKDTLKQSKGLDIWNKICHLFIMEDGKTDLSDIINKIVTNSCNGNIIVLNISGRGASQGMDGLETFYVKLIEDEIRRKGAELYAQGKQSNCLIVMDEAHRYISTSSYETETKELTTSIIDSVRTTRKYGIGYMFITQTIESLHAGIREQIRIFAFGYGLTSGSEF